MLHLLQIGYTPPSPFATPPLVPPALDPLPADWATAQRLDMINMTGFDPTECASIQPRVYQDSWCISACLINFCLDDICTCGTDSEGRTAKERGEAIDKEQLDNWGEAENRERKGDCTVVDCPGGLPSDVGKQANETSQENEDYQNGIDNWKEGEDRQRHVDPAKAYPNGLPAAGQQGEEPDAPKKNAGPPFKPVDPSTCTSLLPKSITDECCVNVNGNCPASMCECDEEKLKEAQAAMAATPVDRDAAIADRDAAIAATTDAPAASRDSRH